MRLEIDHSITISICSRKYWNETDIQIFNGDEYKFETTGFWKDLLKKCDADGYTNLYMNLYNKWKRSGNNNWFALIGSINQTDDFLIGTNTQKAFDKDGKLFCYANDVTGFYWNNFGQVSLKITRLK